MNVLADGRMGVNKFARWPISSRTGVKMKKIVALCSLFVAAPVLANDDVALPPGGSIRVNGTTIRCTGTVNPDAPKCSVSQYNGNTYTVSVGSNRWGYIEGFEGAIKIVKELKESGLCN